VSCAERSHYVPLMVGGNHKRLALIEEAVRHVQRARQIVRKQKVLIERLRAVGADIADAQDTLEAFESSLKIFEDQLRYLQGR
jgi:hypothetical protein